MTKDSLKFWGWALGCVATVLITVSVVSYSLGSLKTQVQSDILCIAKSVDDYKDALVSINNKQDELLKDVSIIKGFLGINVARRTYEENTIFNSTNVTEWLLSSQD